MKIENESFESKLARFRKREANKKIGKQVLAKRVKGGYGYMKSEHKRNEKDRLNYEIKKPVMSREEYKKYLNP